MYYVMNGDNLSIFDDDKEKIEQTKEFMPQLNGQYTLETNIVTANELREHPNKVIVGDIEIEIDVPDEEINIDGEITTHKETIIVKGIIANPNYEEEEAQKERQRLDMLSLTKREVFLALYKDKGITPDQLRAQIQDTEALIEFDYANDYYRGNPLINGIGAMLGYTPEELDYLFEYKDFPQPTSEIEGEG